MDLTHYRSLGRSGLLVSPLALGTMTFGAQRWGSDEAASRAVFDAYVDAGGNFVDTADLYSGGRSEELLGAFIADAGVRDRLVVGTKSGFPRQPGNPNAGGNGARNIRLALEQSLRRLRTDYIDLYWMHVWDRVTPPEAVLQTLADAVRAGKLLHYGFSNTPAWYVARVATLAQAHGLPAPIGLQYQYSLLDRGVELEILPAGNALGLGLMPWSPLGGGLLTGKYGREMLAHGTRAPGLPADGEAAGHARPRDDGRLHGDNPFGGMLFTERNFDIVDVLRGVAEEVGRTPAQVALAWVAQRQGVSSVLIGASRVEQLTQNIASLAVALTPDQQQRLDAASRPPGINPYFIFELPAAMRFGVEHVQGWRAA
ncbi:aldo/keto reductase [Coralloluteibacterium stylophorae]|uniref:Aldo/keto reductase n=1 Tax=Coralloluteibacterium stylophorae TaxID=1776034 RepID=A0A8J7VRG3_9GAMM|nr:aldo/keto reductase [Coralloluteibacterium stylophorae]MBS7456008.1 aldo/keto reductase [Coralloluteibacterium stylophorae]